MPRPAHCASARGEGVRVLVVDDHSEFRDLARVLVAAVPGWSVVAEAASGEEGVALAGQVHPALVLMDVQLPGIDGAEATRRIVASDPGAAVLLVSVHAAEDLPPALTACGALGYVRKDELSPAALRACLAGQDPA